MPYEDFSRDFSESFDDSGLVYTRNKYGRLYSPPGYHFEERSNTSYSDNGIIQGAHCCIKVKDKFFCPRSLFLICLDFVAKNIALVESLVGFPEIMGEQLFNQIYNYNNGLNKNLDTLKLFYDAYGGLALRSLSLAGQHLFVNNNLDLIQGFTALCELDLSHCRLGDEHEIITHIGQMTSIKRLSLKNNSLSDAGIAKVTMPCRMFGVGLKLLTSLDISLNPAITDKAVRYLVKLVSLETLNLSGTKVTIAFGVSQLQNRSNLVLTKQIDEFAVDEFVTSSGWACHYLLGLINQANITSKGNTAPTQTLTTSFYKIKSKKEFAISGTSSKQKPSSLPIILLQCKKLVPQEFIISKNLRNCCKVSTSCQKEIAAKKHNAGPYPSKELENESDSDEEGKLLNSYLCNDQSGRKDAPSCREFGLKFHFER